MNGIQVSIGGMTWNITRDRRQSDRPWIGGRSDGQANTFRTESLDRMFLLIADAIQEEADDCGGWAVLLDHRETA
jgi:hypothetical protein